MDLDTVQMDDNNNPLPMCKCTVCGYEFDCATGPGVDKKRPRPGDLALCLRCGEIHVYHTDMTVRTPTLAELNQLDEETSMILNKVQTLIRKERPLG